MSAMEEDTPPQSASPPAAAAVKKNVGKNVGIDYDALDRDIAAQRLVALEGNLNAALEALLNLEKQMRLAADVSGTRKVVVAIIQLCFDASAWKTLSDQIILISKRRAQLKQAVTAMVQHAMQFIEKLPDMDTRMELIQTLNSVSAGKIYVEIERARLIRKLAKIKEEQGLVAEAAELMQEVAIRVQALHRKQEGTLVLVVFRDTRWSNDKSIIAQAEIDLTENNRQIVYIVPDILLTMADFYNYIQISVQTRGYESWRHGESNLLLSSGIVARISDIPNVGFKFETTRAVEYLMSKGVKAIAGKTYDPAALQGRRWILKAPQLAISQTPTAAATTNLVDGTIAVQFSNYKDLSTNLSFLGVEGGDSDSEELHSEIVAIIFEEGFLPNHLEEEVLYEYGAMYNQYVEELAIEEYEESVHVFTEIYSPIRVLLLTETARMPRRMTPGSAGFDLCTDQTVLIAPGERVLVRTGVVMCIPTGYYGRIAIRSSKSFRDGLEVGAGVIDSDYHAEIMILLYNHDRYNEVYIPHGERIAQIIIEKIHEADVIQVNIDQMEFLDLTRGGFGSTNIQEPSVAGVVPEVINMISDTEYRFAEEEEIITEFLNRIGEKETVAASLDDYPERMIKDMEDKLEKLMSSVTSSYAPPADQMMGPPVYSPAIVGNPRDPYKDAASTSTSCMPSKVQFKRKDFSESWNLPSAMTNTGAILTVPTQLSMFDEVFNRWESITKNVVALQNFSDANEKAEFIENLLGEYEKLAWQQWRTMFDAEYQQLLKTADGRNGTQNIISQIRRIFVLEDPYQGSTLAQEEAYRDIERLQCSDMKDLIQFMNDYMKLASKTGRLFLNSELSDKFFSKLPGELGPRIKKAFSAAYEGNQVGVFPRVMFAYRYLERECKEAAYMRSLKGLQFCSQIPIPGYYKNEKKYGMRRSKTYKGKAHPTHARIDKRKQLVRSKHCKCYLCGAEGHFARDCKAESRNIKRVALLEGINLPPDYEIVLVKDGEEDSDAIVSISEGETNQFQEMHFYAISVKKITHSGSENVVDGSLW